MDISIIDLCKSYHTGDIVQNVLTGFNAEIKSGKICTILGPSGSGKSTLLNILGGLDSADSGKVIVENDDILKYKQDRLCKYRRDKVGFVFQFYNLIPTLNVLENIDVVTNVSKESLDCRELLEDIGMKGMEKRFPNELSGGQQQRVAIARALVKKPELLLCDEPTGALDCTTSKEVLMLLEKMNKKYNTTIIIITHNPAIADMSNQVLKIKNGVLEEAIINENPLSAERIEW